MNITINKIANGYLVSIPDPGKLMAFDDTHYAKDHEELLTVIRDVVFPKIAVARINGVSINGGLSGIGTTSNGTTTGIFTGLSGVLTNLGY